MYGGKSVCTFDEKSSIFQTIKLYKKEKVQLVFFDSQILLKTLKNSFHN